MGFMVRGMKSAMQETWVQSLGWEDLLEKGKATHSSILAWSVLLEYSGRKVLDMTEWLSLSTGKEKQTLADVRIFKRNLDFVTVLFTCLFYCDFILHLVMKHNVKCLTHTYTHKSCFCQR